MIGAFLGIAQQIEADRAKATPPAPAAPQVTAAAPPEQTPKAAEKTETKSTTAPKDVSYVKKRPEDVDPEKLKNLPEVPKNIDALLRESVTLKQRKADLQADVQLMLENAGAPAIDKKLSEIPALVAEELKKFPEKAAVLEDLILTTFTRVTSYEGNLTKEQQALVAKLTTRIKTANAAIARCQENIKKINDEAFAKHGGKKSTAEHVQYFPDPEKRHPRGEASSILTEPIKPTKKPEPAAVPAAQAGMIDQLNVLRGVELDAAQQSRLQKIEAGIIELFRSALKSVKDMVKSLVGIDTDIDKLIESLKTEPAGAK